MCSLWPPSGAPRAVPLSRQPTSLFSLLVASGTQYQGSLQLRWTRTLAALAQSRFVLLDFSRCSLVVGLGVVPSLE
ncbi:hypothetical protein E2C01_065679 [Portunus trituberculatus]|uniref:Uncharacterized protein n=1 Tax=Portunus trituberculatus TaxID=210409 RepID=A0A5B7HF73_PORTR|nr:hypothetical protein [Portunus trituberculatus]